MYIPVKMFKTLNNIKNIKTIKQKIPGVQRSSIRRDSNISKISKYRILEYSRYFWYYWKNWIPVREVFGNPDIDYIGTIDIDIFESPECTENTKGWVKTFQKYRPVFKIYKKIAGIFDIFERLELCAGVHSCQTFQNVQKYQNVKIPKVSKLSNISKIPGVQRSNIRRDSNISNMSKIPVFLKHSRYVCYICMFWFPVREVLETPMVLIFDFFDTLIFWILRGGSEENLAV